jgi:hypothetical protein
VVEHLFIDDINPCDELYRIIRDEDRCAEHKSYLENLWETYHPYADRDFPKQLSFDFHARFWEMYLTCVLISNSLKVVPKQKRSKGPDISIDDSTRKIFLEAITPSQGAENNPDKVPNLAFNTNKAERLPDTEIILRYSSAIADKYEKYRSYLAQGIISSSDAYVIALNSCKIGILAKAEASGFPRIIKAVLPVGDIEVPISRVSEPIVPYHHQYRPTISRSNGSVVPTDLFLEDEYAGLSGVFYADSDISNRPKIAGDEFIFIHNPKSTQTAIPHEYLRLGLEYFIVLVDCQLLN